MVASRPDLTYAISYFGRFPNCFTVTHWKHLKNVRCLKHSPDMALSFDKSNSSDVNINAYVDADFAFDKNDRKSVSGYNNKVNNNVVSWGSRKQGIVALSSCEAEYYGLGDCIKEALFLNKLLNESFNFKGKINIFEDNQGTIKIASTCETKRSKHFDVKYNFVKYIVDTNTP